MISETPVICWLFGAVQVIGLTSAWVARLSAGSRRQTSCHCLFLACLPLVGGAAAFSLGLGLRCWLVCSITLSLMVLTVVCDFSRSQQGTAW
jgi:hypothetical protein